MSTDNKAPWSQRPATRLAFWILYVVVGIQFYIINERLDGLGRRLDETRKACTARP